MFIDIHCHIIPGIDDGAQNEIMALEMLKIAQENNTRHIIATPHYVYGNTRFGFDTIIEKCAELNRIARSAEIETKVYPGCEIFINPEILELYEQRLVGTLNESKYMLIELPFTCIPLYTDNILYKLQLKGITPIIAHPELNSEVQKKIELIEAFVERGILIQVSAGSITGHNGIVPKKTVMKMLKKGLVHFVSSDAHSNVRRTPDMSKAAVIVEKKFGLKAREDLFTMNPMKLIDVNL